MFAGRRELNTLLKTGLAPAGDLKTRQFPVVQRACPDFSTDSYEATARNQRGFDPSRSELTTERATRHPGSPKSTTTFCNRKAPGENGQQVRHEGSWGRHLQANLPGFDGILLRRRRSRLRLILLLAVIRFFAVRPDRTRTTHSGLNAKAWKNPGIQYKPKKQEAGKKKKIIHRILPRTNFWCDSGIRSICRDRKTITHV